MDKPNPKCCLNQALRTQHQVVYENLRSGKGEYPYAPYVTLSKNGEVEPRCKFLYKGGMESAREEALRRLTALIEELNAKLERHRSTPGLRDRKWRRQELELVHELAGAHAQLARFKENT